MAPGGFWLPSALWMGHCVLSTHPPGCKAALKHGVGATQKQEDRRPLHLLCQPGGSSPTCVGFASSLHSGMFSAVALRPGAPWPPLLALCFSIVLWPPDIIALCAAASGTHTSVERLSVGPLRTSEARVCHLGHACALPGRQGGVEGHCCKYEISTRTCPSGGLTCSPRVHTGLKGDPRQACARQSGDSGAAGWPPPCSVLREAAPLPRPAGGCLPGLCRDGMDTPPSQSFLAAGLCVPCLLAPGSASAASPERAPLRTPDRLEMPRTQ